MRINGIAFFATLFFSVTFPAGISAQVVINEFSSSEEWVELYNNDKEEVGLEECELYLHNEGYEQQKITFGEGDSINTFLQISKGEKGWNSNWLNDDGDKLVLNCLATKDEIAYGDHPESNLDKPKTSSVGRNPDGTGDFYILATSTPGATNGFPPTPTPNPTNTPTPTPKPTVTSKPTKTPTNTPSPKPTVMAKTTTTSPTPFRSKSNNKDKEETGRLISDLRENLESKANEEKDDENSTRKLPLFAGIFIVAGFGFMGASLYPFYKKRLSRYNENIKGKELEEDI